jgi:riboflavin kinase/FMN adenylyltransferase
MQLVRYINDLPFDALANGSVVTIGSYDGLHLGHEQLLARVNAVADAQGIPSVVMSFEPMPKEFFSPGDPPARLMRLREKFDALAGHGVDIFYCPRFNAQMRDITADAFIRRILVHGLCATHIVIGDDFRFAARRAGTLEYLQRAGRALGYSVEQVPSVIIDGVRISSTAIREALRSGDLDQATALLGRPYRMSGKVIMGEKIGRSLGYPTANVDLRRRQSAVTGIFAVRVHGLAEGVKDAVASVGTRPTFNGTKPLLEVHIFDFDSDIYGQYIHVDFIGRLRNEVKYDNVADLVAQMHRDADNAKSLLAAHPA